MSFFHTKTFWISFILLMISFLVGLAVGRLSNFNIQKTPAPSSNPSLINPLFSSQTAQIRGKILKVEGDLVTLENSQGIKGQIKATPNVLITKYDNKGKASTVSDLQEIEINKNAIINLEVEAGNLSSDPYRIIAISILPPLPTAK